MTTEPTAPAAAIAPRTVVLGVVGWMWVALPFGYGLVQLLLKVPALFQT